MHNQWNDTSIKYSNVKHPHLVKQLFETWVKCWLLVSWHILPIWWWWSLFISVHAWGCVHRRLIKISWKYIGLHLVRMLQMRLTTQNHTNRNHVCFSFHEIYPLLEAVWYINLQGFCRIVISVSQFDKKQCLVMAYNIINLSFDTVVLESNAQ